MSQNIAQILNGGKSQTYADSINNTVIMLIKIGIPAQDKPQSKKFKTLLGDGGHKKCL